MKIQKITVIAMWSVIILLISFLFCITAMQASSSFFDKIFLGITSLLLAGGCAVTYIYKE